VTFSQVAFVTCQGLIFTSRFFTVKRAIALKDYSLMVFMFFTTNICYTNSLNYNIPMPLTMIFGAGSLMANMVMGIVILKKRYSFSKYLSVIMITIGIVIYTASSASSLKKANEAKQHVAGETSDLFWMSIGILLLTISLFTAARMGVYQEVLYQKYGKHPTEALFFVHLMTLPAFIFLADNILDHAIIAVNSEAVQVFSLNLPRQIIYIVGDVLTQFLCIRSVYVLTTECPSLTVTLVITLRKFVSIMFSIIYFKNPFTLAHWIGTVFVFIGTVIFTEMIQTLDNFCERSKVDTKHEHKAKLLLE
jgi:solute carrier family 35 (UDP-xylose/UDP-N-acetylglucosamine transporter), member B4